MDLRVYVDGVARIICDLTRTTTVHDIIIALAQYKGKAGRYSLVQRAPDGAQRTLSPNELTSELIHHPDWAYILRQNPANRSHSNGQKRSKSLDGRKTPTQQQEQQQLPTQPSPQQQQTYSEVLPPVTSPAARFRTVHGNTFAAFTSEPANNKRANIHQIFSSINTNNNNNHRSDSTPSSPVSRQRLSRTPVHESHTPPCYPRPKSALPSSLSENSAFHIVHNPNSSYTSLQQQQQYLALLQLLKSQEIQAEQQEQELNEKQKEIEYREAILRQAQLYHESIQHELQILEEHDRRLTSECQTYAKEYSSDALEFELECYEKLRSNYEHVQQQLARCSSTIEQKRQVQEQLQFNVKQIHEELEEVRTNINNDKKVLDKLLPVESYRAIQQAALEILFGVAADILQYEYDLQRAVVSFKQQEDLLSILNQRNDDIERIIQQDQKDIIDFEDVLIEFEDLLIHDLPNTSYHFHETTSNGVLMPVHLQFMNSALLKICPSGIWV